MNTSYPRKLFDLSASLVRTPRSILPYFRYLPLWKNRPIDVELPWFSFSAVNYLRKFIRPAHTVFEFGSGGSSFYFARRAARVTSMESHAAWHALVHAMACSRNLVNLSCEFHPLIEGQLTEFRQSSFFHRVRAEQWDIIVIDCFCGFETGGLGHLRPYAFELALPQVKPGGLIVLDDSWMYPELLAPRPGWEIRDFRGPGPCRYGFTSTAIFRRLE